MLKKVFITMFIFMTAPLVQAQSVQKTSLHFEDCQILEQSELQWTSKSLCPSVADFKVYYKTFDLRGWIELEKNGKVYDTWEMITANAIGNAPYIGEELLWHLNENGNVESLIFEVRAQDPQNIHEEIKLYFIAVMAQDKLVFVSQEISLAAAQERVSRLQKLP
jgi:hypothetical protein